MAAILRKAGVGKTVTSSASANALASVPRYSSSSMHEKNSDDRITETVVQDKAAAESKPEDYWIPHPETGVFVPPADQDVLEDVDVRSGSLSEESVLGQQVFFRPSGVEDTEKPLSIESLEVEVEAEGEGEVAEADARREVK